MQGHWLQKKANNSRCTLFMAGWGMGPEPFASLAADDCDLFVCYDYRELTPLDMGQFAGYSRLDLLAWSMGVWVAAYLFAEQKTGCFSKATALGGTLQPLDDRKGIPISAFEATLQNLDEVTLEDFYRSMFDDPARAERFMMNRPSRSVASVREELISLKDSIRGVGMVQDIFNHKIVTMRDRIVPGRNQLRAWGKQHCESERWPHFPFYEQDLFTSRGLTPRQEQQYRRP